MSIFDFTPKGYEKTKEKTEILSDIETHIKKGTKYILIEAPTGIGKSWIAGDRNRRYYRQRICNGRQG